MKKIFHMHYHWELAITFKMRIVTLLKFISKKRTTLYQVGIHSFPPENKGRNTFLSTDRWSCCAQEKAVIRSFVGRQQQLPLLQRLTAGTHRGSLGTAKERSIVQIETFLTHTLLLQNWDKYWRHENKKKPLLARKHQLGGSYIWPNMEIPVTLERPISQFIHNQLKIHPVAKEGHSQ